MENRCVCCGEIIPEGIMVCPACELSSEDQKGGDPNISELSVKQ